VIITATQAADQFRTYDLLLVAGILSEVFCTGCLLLRQSHRSLPILTAYLAFMSLADMGGTAVYLTGTTSSYWSVFIGVSGIEYCLQIAVMCELIHVLFVPLRSGLRYRWLLRASLLWTALLIITASLFAAMAEYRRVDGDATAFCRQNIGYSVFRALLLVSIVCLALMVSPKSAKWQVAPVASTLSLYSVGALLCQIAQEHLGAHNADTIEGVRIVFWCMTVILIGTLVLAGEQYRPQKNGTSDVMPLTLQIVKGTR